MTHDWPQMTRQLAAAIREVRTGAHDVAEALAAIGASADPHAEIDPATRELVALAMAVVLRSDGWMTFRAEAAARQGVARAQVVEALGMALSMDDTLSLAEVGKVLEAFDRFAAAAP